MEHFGGHDSDRPQSLSSGDSDPRQNKSIRRRIGPSGVLRDESRPCSKSFPPEDRKEPQKHVGGPTLRPQPQSEGAQHKVSHAEVDNGPAPTSTSVHMSLQALALQLQALKEQDAELQQDDIKLKAQVKDSEAVCGRMIQQYLEIARAIAMRKQHIQEDKAKLEDIQRSRDRIEADVTAIMAQIASSINPGSIE